MDQSLGHAENKGKTGTQDKPEGGRGWCGVWEDGLRLWERPQGLCLSLRSETATSQYFTRWIPSGAVSSREKCKCKGPEAGGGRPIRHTAAAHGVEVINGVRNTVKRYPSEHNREPLEGSIREDMIIMTYVT